MNLSKYTREYISLFLWHDLAALLIGIPIVLNADNTFYYLILSINLISFNIGLSFAKMVIPKYSNSIEISNIILCGLLLTIVPIYFEKNTPFWLFSLFLINKHKNNNISLTLNFLKSITLIGFSITPYLYFNIWDENIFTPLFIGLFFAYGLLKEINLLKSQKIQTKNTLKIIEKCPDGIMQIDSKGVIIACNQAALQILQIDQQKASILGHSFLNLINLKNRSQDIETLKNIFSKDKASLNSSSLQFENILLNSQIKTKIYVETQLSLIYNPGISENSREGHYILYFRPNTEIHKIRKENENQHLKIISMSKLASIGEIAEGISDELHKQLTMIQSRMKILQNLMQEKTLSDENVENISTIVNNISENMRYAIKGIHVFSKNITALPFIYIKFDTLIQEIIDTCSFNLKNKNIDIIYDQMEEDLSDKKIYCQSDRIVQGFLQIFHILAKFAIKLDTSQIVLCTRLNNKNIQIIFRIISSNENPIHSNHNFELIGLELTKEIISDHSGNVTVNPTSLSEIISISLPIVIKEESSKNHQAA